MILVVLLGIAAATHGHVREAIAGVANLLLVGLSLLTLRREVRAFGWSPVRRDWRIWVALALVIFATASAATGAVIQALWEVALGVMVLGSASWARTFKRNGN
ncbi:MAG: hypothetical protein JO186_03835 [Actinobacteria bacterium]|nr:hypothetical protein [Actinomycetota bacterium]